MRVSPANPLSAALTAQSREVVEWGGWTDDFEPKDIDKITRLGIHGRLFGILAAFKLLGGTCIAVAAVWAHGAALKAVSGIGGAFIFWPAMSIGVFDAYYRQPRLVRDLPRPVLLNRPTDRTLRVLDATALALAATAGVAVAVTTAP